MARVVDLTGENITRQRRKDRQYGTKTDLSSTTVDRGDTHWMNGSRVSIDGILDVTGQTTISGALNVSGTTTLSGSTTIAGPTGITGALTIAGSMDVTGPSTFSGTLGINGATTITGATSITGELDVTGPTTLAGTLDITGDTTVTGDLSVEGPLDVTGDTTLGGSTEITGPTILKNNLTVDPAKRIILGGLVLENQGAGTAQMNVPGGSISASTTLGMLINHSLVHLAGQTEVKLESILINLNAPQTSVNGNLVVTGTVKVGTTTELSQTRLRVGSLPNMPGGVPNVRVETNGIFYRCT